MQNVPHQVVNMDLSQTPPWFMELCESEGVPAAVSLIHHQGKAQADSEDICWFVHAAVFWS